MTKAWVNRKFIKTKWRQSNLQSEYICESQNNFICGWMWRSEIIQLSHDAEATARANVSVVNADKLAVTLRAWAAWAALCSRLAAPAVSVKCAHVTQLRFSHITLNFSPCKQILSRCVVPDWKVLLEILRMCFSESAYLTLKAPHQSLSPLMTKAHLALSRLVLKAWKVLGVPQWEVGNWSFEVLYVFLLISSNSLMCVYI